MDYITETLSFIESAEMREYLRVVPEALDRYTCAEIVSNAPSPLERKIAALDLIAEQTEYDPECDFRDPAKLAREARFALDERFNNPPGAVFLLLQKDVEDYTLCTTFDAALRYLHSYEKVEDDPDRIHDVWYTIEKWILGEDGKMTKFFYWILYSAGEIWYSNYGDHKLKPEGWDEFYDYLGNVNLPVPFKPGDIVLANCRPFAEEQMHVLILETGDNCDCCAVQCLYVRGGKLDTSAFKHQHYLRKSSHVSVLYRTTRYDGELSEEEVPLAVLSAAVKENTVLGAVIWNCIHEYEYDRTSERMRWADGIYWKLLKEKLDL